MRISLVAAAALLITSAGAASAQTLTFQDLPDWNYVYNYNGASTTITTGGFNFTASPYVYSSYYAESFFYTYDQSSAQAYGITSPSKLLYSFTSDVTLSKADNGRFSFEGAQLGSWDYYGNNSFSVEGIRNGVVVDQAIVNTPNNSYTSTTFSTSWANLDSVVIKPVNSYTYGYYTGTNGQAANYVWLGNVQVNAATPEASTWILMGLGCIGMMAFARRRQLAFDV